jgi:hypothetical protein
MEGRIGKGAIISQWTEITDHKGKADGVRDLLKFNEMQIIINS